MPDATRVDHMSRKLHTKAGAAVYAARKAIVEPVIGQIKQARGFRPFLLRGLEKVQGEWSRVCTTHNMLKLYRLSQRDSPPTWWARRTRQRGFLPATHQTVVAASEDAHRGS